MTWYLEVTEGPDRGVRATFRESEIIIGRDPVHCVLVISDYDASRLHARVLLLENGTVQLEDMGSTNGTFVNGTRINHPVTLEAKDIVQLGGSKIELSWSDRAGDVYDRLPTANSINIGRHSSNDLIIDHPEVSRYHARLDKNADGTFYLNDLDSTQGTFLSGQKVRGAIEISPYSWIQIGKINYYFNGEALLSEQGLNVISFNEKRKREQKSLSVQIFQAISIPFAEGIPLKLLLGSILSVIPFVNLLAEGYRYRVLESSIAEKMEMPEWEQWITLLLKGIRLYFLKVFYIIVPTLLTMFFLFFSVNRLAAGIFGLVEVGLLLSLFLLLLMAFLLPMGWSHFVATGEFASAFKLLYILKLINLVLPQYLAVLLLVLAMWLINASIALIPVAGWFLSIFLFFFIQVVSMLLFGGLYRTALIKEGSYCY